MALRVIVGGGFGGLQAALRLRRARLDVTLMTGETFTSSSR
jgi:thioredoxin reductase